MIQCAKYGTVVDIFISKYLSKAGKCYGFIRFIKVDDQVNLAKQLCTIWFGSFKLYASADTHDRGLKRSRKTHVVGPKKQDRVSHAVSSNERSYADVVQPKVKSIVARESDNMLQLKVGDFVYDSKDTGKLIMEKVKSIDMLAVIISRCKVQGFPEVEEWFSELTHWNRDFVCDKRLVWLDIEGMPLRSWCKSNFEKVANRWGQVVYMDGNLGISLAVHRLCVETKVMGIITEEMTVMINNHVFILRIREAVGLWPTFVKEEDDVSLEDEPLLDANDFKEE
ncbi:hypothetical protein L2E82_04666 [Cichorium intybus]|uniref:Uncharacterized protein n=1 Tax=Cichorium intybus TaxID=13427 RepID=A0ACB9H757_CICIN|nr:hypothetical protein L2E82_04666 [Cichorium intybus]